MTSANGVEVRVIGNSTKRKENCCRLGRQDSQIAFLWLIGVSAKLMRLSDGQTLKCCAVESYQIEMQKYKDRD